MAKVAKRTPVAEKTVKERVAAMWKLLNSYGIYTEAELDQALKDNPLDIGIFTMPYEKRAMT